jgi:regulator of sirC expression with transglutaminase-like and TPR domain
VTEPPAFADLARRAYPRLDELALAIAGAFRAVDAGEALATLDALGADLTVALAEGRTRRPDAEAIACAEVLGRHAGFAGDAEHYDDPANSMLDVVLERRRGLPILLSVVYVEVARRAGVALAGVGLPGHFVVGHFGVTPPVLLDPFGGGAPVESDQPAGLVRPWHAHEIALRMLNNLVGSYRRRGDIGSAIRAAAMRLDLPTGQAMHDAMRQELLALQAQLN